MKAVKLLVLIVPILSWLLSEAVFIWPQMFWVDLVLLALLNFFASRQFALFANNKQKWLPLSLLPFLFSLSILSFSILVPIRFLVHVLMFTLIPILYKYYKALYFYLFDKKNYPSNYLVNFSSYLNFLTVYFIASAIFGLREFVNVPEVFYILIISSVFIIMLIVAQVFWANNLLRQENYLFILLLTVIITQISWVSAFLSISFYITGLIVAICYYIIIGLTRFYLLGTLTAQLARLYLIFGFISLFLVLFTSRWI
jgi:hypothetical protein